MLLIRLALSLNVLVISCYWLGCSEYVLPLADWRGLVCDTVAVLTGMGAAAGIISMCLKSNGGPNE